MAKALTPKQRRFVAEYLVDLNATQAAVRAGYSERTASATAARLFRNVKVGAAIQEAAERRQGRTEITQDRVLQMLRDNAMRAMQRVPVLNDEGKPSGEWRYEGSVANKALELLGRHLSLFNEKHKHEHTGPGGGAIPVVDITKLQGMDDEELAALERALDQIGLAGSGEGGEAAEGD